ncbi:MAG: hypothetical protein ACK4NQ_09850 [Fimbriimonadaceae bacterium]
MKPVVSFRSAWLGVACLSAMSALAQAEGPSLDSLQERRPAMSILVRKHQMGADMVQVTMLKGDYPSELLRQQILLMPTYGTTPPRGLEIFGGSPGKTLRQAMFAVDGLLKPETGEINFEAIVKPFLGSPEPFEIDTMIVVVEGMPAVPNTTLVEHATDTVLLKGVPLGNDSMEYRISVASQDPEKVKIPSKYQPVGKPEAQAKGSSGHHRQRLLIGIGVAGVIAAGALVYSLTRRR